MLSSIATILVNLLGTIASTATSSSQIDAVISAMENLIPALVGELSSLVTPVKNIIAALGAGSVALTAAQSASLQALDAQCDALIDATAKADGLSTGDDAATS